MTVSLLNNLNIYVQEKNRLQTEKSKLEEKLLNYQPFRFLNEPYVQDSPVAPRKLFNLAIAGVLGVFVALFYVFMKNYFFDEKAVLKKD
ncbi:MAG: GNVR domain-containing protein [Halanaerobiales bacterium]